MKRYLASLLLLMFSLPAGAALNGQGNATIIGPMVSGHCVMSGGATLLKDAGAACGGGGGGSGTVTSVSVVSAAGVSGTVANPTTTPAITIALGNITPASVNAAGLILGSNFSGSSSGTNTGDQTSVSGNAGTATKLANGRTIAMTGDVSWITPTFDGSANVTAAGTLATVNTNVGSFGSATQVAGFTVNGKGLITAASNTSIQIAESQVTNLTTDLAGKQTTVSLTTTGTSGAATFNATTGALNIPNYTTSGGTGTVTSVDVSGGTTGLTTSGGPVTTSGTITLAGTLGAANGGTGVSNTGTLTYSGSASVTGSNTGDQTTITGNAGTATKWQTARLLAGNSVDGSANVPFANKFIVQGTTDAGLTGAQFLGALSTGIVKNTTTTGVLSIATAGTDYEVPLTFSTGLTRSTNTITVNTSQNISTLSNLTSNGLVKTSGGTGALSIATAGTDYQAPITLTTTGTSGSATFASNTLNIPNYANTTYSAGTGLTLTGTTFSVNTSQNIATLSNLTSNGIVTTSGGTGALSITATTGTGSVVLATSPTLVTPALGTPSALVGTNITGTGAGFTSGITNALASATTTVNVSSATAPTSGQVLTATGGTAATWQTPTGGGGTPGGSTTQMQYNNAGAFGGATWAYTATGGGLAGTTTLANGLVVGANGATNPALQVDASTASSATGLAIKSAAAGSGVSLTAISSATDEALTISAKGGGGYTMNSGSNFTMNTAGFNGNYFFQLTGNTLWFANAFQQQWTLALPSGTAANTPYSFVGQSGTTAAMTASTEATDFLVNMAQTRQHATGALTTQRDIRFEGSTHTFVAASTITNAAAFSVDGASIAGTNATITNSSAIYVPGSAVGSGVTNSYGLLIEPNTGATNNFAAGFGGNVDMQGNALLNPKMPGGIVTANFPVTSSATLTNVTGLTDNLVAGKAYEFRAVVYATSGSAGGIKVAMGGTATTTNYRSTSMAYNGSVLVSATNGTLGATEYSAMTITATTVVIEGSFICNAAGTLAVQFAQNTSSATASNVLVGSNLTITRLTI